MKAVKDNKEYTITENEKASYLAQGYDICDDEGNVVEHSPQSTVPYADFEAVVSENFNLRFEIEELRTKLAEKSSKKGKDNVSES